MAAVAETIYVLCGLTALACAWLLFRGYRRTGAKILLWSTVCFVFLTANNVLLFVDLVVLPGPAYDLRPIRDLTSLTAMGVLVAGLILSGD